MDTIDLPNITGDCGFGQTPHKGGNAGRLLENHDQHQPLNRQRRRYAHASVDLSLSTMVDRISAGDRSNRVEAGR